MPERRAPRVPRARHPRSRGAGRLAALLALLAMFGVGVGVGVGASAEVGTETGDDKARAAARLVADTSAFAPGGTFRLGVLFTMDPRWHIYWHSPREGGLATQVKWRLPEGWRAGPLEWPAPSRFVLAGPIVAYGYDKEVLLASEITVPADWKAEGSVTLGADLSWLVCDEEACKIGEGKPEFVLAPGAPAPSAEAARFARWRARVPVNAERAGIAVEESLAGSGERRTWRVALSFPEGKTPAAGAVRAFPFDIPGGNLDEGRVETEGKRLVFTFGVEVSGKEFDATRIGAVLSLGAEASDAKAPAAEAAGVRVVEVLHKVSETGAARP